MGDCSLTVCDRRLRPRRVRPEPHLIPHQVAKHSLGLGAMAQWELTSKLGPFLDRHLVIPLLEFLSVNGKEIYDESDLLKGKLELLSGTNMIDFAMDVHKTLYPDQPVPKDLLEKRPKVVAEYSRLQEATKPLAETFAD